MSETQCDECAEPLPDGPAITVAARTPWGPKELAVCSTICAIGALDTLFLSAYLDEPVPEEVLRAMPDFAMRDAS